MTYSNSPPSSLTLSLGQTTTVQAGSGGPNLSGCIHRPPAEHSARADDRLGRRDGQFGPRYDDRRSRSRPDDLPAQPNSTSYLTPGTYSISATISGMDGTASDDPSVTVTPAPAEVMIGAILPAACQSENSECIFAVTCGGGSAGSVTVNFSLGGSAVYGTAQDYVLSGSGVTVTGSGGTITLAGGAASTVYIYVNPHYPNVRGPSKTVSLTLSSGTGYTVVSGWSAATGTIYYDTPTEEGDPGSETAVTMTCYSPNGSQTESECAPLGDCIPIGLGTAARVEDPYSVSGILTYPSSLIVSLYPGGPNIGSGSSGTLVPTETILYVSAANPTADQANGVAASGEIDLEGTQFGSPIGTCSVNVDFEPLQMDNNGANITGTTPTIKIGQFVELQVKDPSGWGGLVAWSMPSGTTVEEYHPQVNGATANLCRLPISATAIFTRQRLVQTLASSCSPPVAKAGFPSRG